MKRLVLILAYLCLALSGVARAANQPSVPLVARLGTDHVKLGTGFTGKSILVYGSIASGGEVIIKLSAPDEPVSLTHKIHIGPFWLSGKKVSITGAPAIAQILSSKPINEFVSKANRTRWGFELASMLSQASANPSSRLENWRMELLKAKQASGEYSVHAGAVKIIDNRLFRARFFLPSNVPTGTSKVEVYLVRQGVVVAHQTLRLKVSEGVGQFIVYASRHHPWVFGLVLSLIALFFGMSFSVLLSKISRS